MAIDIWLLERVRASLPDRDLPNTNERRSEFMRRLPQFDEDDFQGLIDKLAAAKVDDTVVGGDNAVGRPGCSNELPYILDRFGRSRHRELAGDRTYRTAWYGSTRAASGRLIGTAVIDVSLASSSAPRRASKLRNLGCIPPST